MSHDFAQRDPPDVPDGTESLLSASHSDFALTVTCQTCDLVIMCNKCYHLFALKATDFAAGVSTRTVWVLSTSLDTEWHRVCLALQLLRNPSEVSSFSICGAGGNFDYGTSAFKAVCTFNSVLVPPFISRGAPR
jgi:hypothetical protein